MAIRVLVFCHIFRSLDCLSVYHFSTVYPCIISSNIYLCITFSTVYFCTISLAVYLCAISLAVYLCIIFSAIYLYITSSTICLYIISWTVYLYITSSTIYLYIISSTVYFYIISSTVCVYIIFSTVYMYIISSTNWPYTISSIIHSFILLPFFFVSHLKFCGPVVATLIFHRTQQYFKLLLFSSGPSLCLNTNIEQPVLRRPTARGPWRVKSVINQRSTSCASHVLLQAIIASHFSRTNPREY